MKKCIKKNFSEKIFKISLSLSLLNRCGKLITTQAGNPI
jgi:hypothetical protein